VPHTNQGSAAHDTGQNAGLFEATRWSIVVAASGGAADSQRPHRALEHLCMAYWKRMQFYTDIISAAALVVASSFSIHTGTRSSPNTSQPVMTDYAF